MRRFLLIAIFVLGWAPGAWAAPEWGGVAVISDTMGINANRLCTGEASRGDIGCPSYAPYVSSSGFVGIGTSDPSRTLHVHGNTGIGITSNAGQRTQFYITNGGNARFQINTTNTSPFKTELITGNTSVPMGLGAGINSNQLVLAINGYVGVSTTNPSTSLHVDGTLRIANGGEACDANRAGAIRYNSGTFEFCAGSAWQSLATVATSALALDDLTDAAKDVTNSNLWLGVNMAVLANNTNNTAVGIAALDALSNSAGVNEGDRNTAVGNYALSENTTGYRNIAVGYASLYANTTGYYNTAVGTNGLYLNTTGLYNSALGSGALYSNNGGNYNTGVGLNALYYSQSGSYNVGVGGGAGQGAAAMSVTGTTAVGYAAGYNLTTNGNYNTLLGYNAGSGITSGAYNIMIGMGTSPTNAADSYKLNIGNTIYGDMSTDNVGIGTANPVAALDVSGTIKVAGTGTETCGASNYGTIRWNSSTGKMQMCRPPTP